MAEMRFFFLLQKYIVVICDCYMKSLKDACCHFRYCSRRVAGVYKLAALEFHVLVEKGRPFLSTSNQTSFIPFMPDSSARGPLNYCWTTRHVLVFHCSSVAMCNLMFYPASVIGRNFTFCLDIHKMVQSCRQERAPTQILVWTISGGKLMKQFDTV